MLSIHATTHSGTAGARLAWALGAVLLATGCTGRISGGGKASGVGDGAPSPGASAGVSGGSATDAGVAGAAGAAEIAPVSQDPGTVVLHRLNRAEYNNTVHDLLGTAQTPADTFPPDGVSGGFDNNASALTLSTTELRLMESAAESLAEEAADPKGAVLGRIAPCTGTNTQPCLQQFVRNFGLRAWRRPLADDEVAAMVAVAHSGVQQFQETYAQQVERAFMAFLTSPHFLFRVELDADPTSSVAHPLGAYELASRISYFLWSSMPDDALLASAKDGSLLTDDGLGAALERMLGDGHMKGLAQNFAGQWLALRDAAAFAPDPTIFPGWSTALRDDMVQQTQLTFTDLLQGSSSLTDLFLSDSTYLNDRLATFYGLTPPGSTTLVKVPVPAGPRRGILTQGAVLSATSFPVRTSLVRRGQYIEGNLLCSPLPPPPVDVPPLPPGSPSGPQSQRQRLAAHVTAAVCQGCHGIMDPLGFVLEQFDATGALRTMDGNVPIDTSATLADGKHVANVQELQSYMASDARIPNCFVQQVATYALGRALGPTDSATLSQLQLGFASSGQHIDQVIRQVVTSPAFRQRHGGS
jgi:Protein of unknown function (DUF1592)/Protein of unknown function (DUF1588)/Protein of unknown function (DUF1587)/Protein of unknown function (DUF1595)/Protein of unknown function (DUF1585)